jgi:hypothetical protein
MTSERIKPTKKMHDTTRGWYTSEVKAERRQVLWNELKKVPGNGEVIDIEQNSVQELSNAFRSSNFMRSYGLAGGWQGRAALVGPLAHEFLNTLLRDESRIDCGTLARERESTLRIRFRTHGSDEYRLIDYSGDRPVTIFQSASWTDTMDKLSSLWREEVERPGKRIRTEGEDLPMYTLSIPSKKLHFEFFIGRQWIYSAHVHIYVTSRQNPVSSIAFRIEPDHHAIVISLDEDPGSTGIVRDMIGTMLSRRLDVLGITPMNELFTIERWVSDCLRVFQVSPSEPQLDEIKASMSRFSDIICKDDPEVAWTRFAESMLDVAIPLMSSDHSKSKKMGEDVWRAKLRRVREDCFRETQAFARHTYPAIGTRVARAQEYMREHPESCEWLADAAKAIHFHWHMMIAQTYADALERKSYITFPMSIARNFSTDVDVLVDQAMDACHGGTKAFDRVLVVPDTPRASAVSVKSLALVLAKKIWNFDG